MKNIIIRHNQIFKIEGSCCLERLLWELRIHSGGGALLLGIELHGVVCNLAVLSGCDKDHFYIVVVRVTWCQKWDPL